MDRIGEIGGGAALVCSCLLNAAEQIGETGEIGYLGPLVEICQTGEVCEINVIGK